MVTYTSLLHPTAQERIREAMLAAAADTCGLQQCVSDNELLVTYRPCGQFRFEDVRGKDITTMVRLSVDLNIWRFVSTLAECLAGDSTEKIWS